MACHHRVRRRKSSFMGRPVVPHTFGAGAHPALLCDYRRPGVEGFDLEPAVDVLGEWEALNVEMD